MRILVWQWGRRGAGPLVAAAMAHRLAAPPGVETLLSLSTSAELLSLPGAPVNDVPIRTYKDHTGFVARILTAPWLIPALARTIRAARVDAALCAMPAPFDVVMAAALRRARVPYAVVVHDAQLHPGDAFPMQMMLQRSLLRRAGLLFALSGHVAEQLGAQGYGATAKPLLRASLPPFVFGPAPPQPRAHGGPLRLLSFGRLLPYKGLDLLAEAMDRLAGQDVELRVVGSGPESPTLDRLRRIPHVAVENRWVPEAELGALLGWADALVLTHREASQSGVAAAAITARRWIVATRVGGLEEQLAAEPMAFLCLPNPDSIAAAVTTLLASPLPALPSADDWTGPAQSITHGLLQMLNAAAADPATSPRRGTSSCPPPASPSRPAVSSPAPRSTQQR